MTQMPETLTLEQVEYLRRTLPHKSMADLMPAIDVDKIIQTQVQVIDGQEVFIPTEEKE
jgi:isocitrate dehydrogenase kinase/phosphatase